MGEATTTPEMDYFRMPRPLWRKLKKHLPKPRNRESAKGGWPRASERALADAQIGTCSLDRMPMEGCSSRLVRGLIKRRPRAFPERWRGAGIFEKLMRWMVEYYATERGGIGWKWQAMDSKHSPAPLGGQKVGNNPTHRGKLGAKIKLLLVDERGAPLSVVLTGANRHDTKCRPSI